MGQAYPLGHVLGTQDPGFPCPDDFRLVSGLARAPFQGVFSQGPAMLLMCSRPTSESGPAAAVCERGCVCAWRLACRLECLCVHVRICVGRGEGVDPEARDWLPMTPCSGTFQTINEIVFVKVGG